MTSSPREERFDWERLLVRLRSAESALAGTFGGDPERARAILEERARALARPFDPAGVPGRLFLEFVSGGQSFALGLEHLLGVKKREALAALPGAPRFVRGLAPWRGEMLPVLDLGDWFGGERAALAEPGFLAVLGESRPWCAVLADAIERVAALAPESLNPPPPSMAEPRRETLAGITAEGTLVLNGEAILRLTASNVPERPHSTDAQRG